MGRNARKQLIDAVRPRYRSGNKAQKRQILDELCATLHSHRKAVIRMLNRPAPSTVAPHARQGRPPRLTPDDVGKLNRLAVVCQWPCGKRLQAMLPLWIDFDIARYGDYVDGQKERLLSLSCATLDRYLRPLRRRAGIKGRSGTKPGALLRQQIPIRSGPWEVNRPGYIEADTVAHCGHSLAGQFAWTVTLTDIHSTWTECRAVWHKQVLAVRDAIMQMDEAMPFTILGFDCDNGGEFLNHTLIKYFASHPDKPTFTRSRPYRKNDNAHVEQKNWTHARQLWGYQRIDARAAIEAMNALYRREVSWLNNLFTPSMKLISKVRIGSKIVKRYDRPQTPLQRLLSGAHHTNEVLAYEQLAKRLDPITLRESIDEKIRAIITHASVTSF